LIGEVEDMQTVLDDIREGQAELISNTGEIREDHTAISAQLGNIQRDTQAVRDDASRIAAYCSQRMEAESSAVVDPGYHEVINEQVAGDWFFVMLSNTALLTMILGGIVFLGFKAR
jgi:hypothetical protein